jgi:hypothetical protein
MSGRVALRPIWGQTVLVSGVSLERSMSETIDALLYDMLAWLARGAQPYADVMDAWRTSCPRLTVWEEAVERDLVEHARIDRIAMVRITPEGRAFLSRR